MAMTEITVESVQRAMAEFDALGRDPFLAKYKFGRAREYFLVDRGRRYDSKAIVGAAHGHLRQGHVPLTAAEFSGGEKTVAALLDSLGFQVQRLSKRDARHRMRLGKKAMVERIGGTLTNVRWGWDATLADGSIVFIGWDYRAMRDDAGEVVSCEIFNYATYDTSSPGASERARHIAHLLETGAVGYLLIATPKDREVRPHEIDSFDERLFSVRLERDSNFVRARVVGENSTPDLPVNDIASDVQEIQARTDLPETEKLQLVQARRGQGLFRARVEQHERGCRITGVTDRAHLRAGHIKPWRVATGAERLDGNNGLLLAPHIDHLFDRGFLGFEDYGGLLISPRLSPEVLEAWGISIERNGGSFTEAQRTYLAYHREHVFLR